MFTVLLMLFGSSSQIYRIYLMKLACTYELSLLLKLVCSSKTVRMLHYSTCLSLPFPAWTN